MSTILVDSTVIIHLYRKNPNALSWLASQQSNQLSITSITWLEIMRGVPSKLGQLNSKLILKQFDIIYLTRTDQVWAMAQIEQYRLSHGIEMNDCLIASVAYRLQVPIYTHNTKDMLKILPSNLVIQPYKF